MLITRPFWVNSFNPSFLQQCMAAEPVLRIPLQAFLPTIDFISSSGALKTISQVVVVRLSVEIRRSNGVFPVSTDYRPALITSQPWPRPKRLERLADFGKRSRAVGFDIYEISQRFWWAARLISMQIPSLLVSSLSAAPLTPSFDASLTSVRQESRPPRASGAGVKLSDASVIKLLCTLLGLSPN